MVLNFINIDLNTFYYVKKYMYIGLYSRHCLYKPSPSPILIPINQYLLQFVFSTSVNACTTHSSSVISYKLDNWSTAYISMLLYASLICLHLFQFPGDLIAHNYQIVYLAPLLTLSQ